VEGGLREERGARFLILRFENDGPIIAEADLERIFNPFCTCSSDGTGLGLAIAERLAEAHRGFLEVQNTGRERGVAFTLLLPLDSDGSKNGVEQPQVNGTGRRRDDGVLDTGLELAGLSSLHESKGTRLVENNLTDLYKHNGLSATTAEVVGRSEQEGKS
jgi:hypothetical protein